MSGAESGWLGMLEAMKNFKLETWTSACRCRACLRLDLKLQLDTPRQGRFCLLEKQAYAALHVQHDN